MNSTYPWAVLTNSPHWLLLGENRKGEEKGHECGICNVTASVFLCHYGPVFLDVIGKTSSFQ